MKMEKELEDMKGGLKEMKEYLSLSKSKENIYQETDASLNLNKSSNANNDDDGDDDDIYEANALTSSKPMDVTDKDNNLDETIHDQNKENLDIVITKSDYNVSHTGTTIPKTNLDNAYHYKKTKIQALTRILVPQKEEKEEDDDSQNKIELHNTQGIYLHAILAVGYKKAGPIKCWIFAIGTFSFVSLQIVLLDFVRDNQLLINMNGANFCVDIGPALFTTLLAMSIIFTTVVFEDIEESVVEEAILMHTVTHRKDKISSPPALGLIRICLRVRRLLLPWYLNSCVMLLMFSGTNINSSGIILNYMSISVIIEADNVLGRFLFSKTSNHIAEQLVEQINREYHNHHDDDEEEEDKKDMFIPTSSHVWPRMLAIIPTMSMVIGSIILNSISGCEDRMIRFMDFFAVSVLPHSVLLIFGLSCCIQSKYNSNNSLFEKYIRFMGDLMLNMVAWITVGVVTTMVHPIKSYSDVVHLRKLGLLWLSLLLGLLLRSIYVNHIVNNQEKTWKHVLYVLVLTSGFIVGYIDLFVDACFGINLIPFLW